MLKTQLFEKKENDKIEKPNITRTIFKYKDGDNLIVPISQIIGGTNVTVSVVKDSDGNDTDQVIINASGVGPTPTVDIRGVTQEVSIQDAVDPQTSQPFKRVRLETDLTLRDGTLNFGSAITGAPTGQIRDLSMFFHRVTL